MFYAPHILQVESVEVEYNELGEPAVTSDGYTDVSPCRCDHNSTADLIDDAGQKYRPNYHIVAEKADGVKEGDKVRCLDRSDESVKGEGIVKELKKSNVFPLMELYVD